MVLRNNTPRIAHVANKGAMYTMYTCNVRDCRQVSCFPFHSGLGKGQLKYVQTTDILNVADTTNAQKCECNCECKSKASFYRTPRNASLGTADVGA